MKPWNAEHAAGKVTRPLRHNGQPYSGINILMFWASAMEQGFAAPIWMTLKQALELNAHVRKGEKGSGTFAVKRLWGGKLVDWKWLDAGIPHTALSASGERILSGRTFWVVETPQGQKFRPVSYQIKRHGARCWLSCYRRTRSRQNL
jgi:hypothetical protein